MKLIEFKKNINEKNLNKKKVIISLSVLMIIVVLVILIALYVTDTNFRNFIDTNIFRKNITENNTSVIEIEAKNNQHFYAYDRYVVVLEKNTLTRYNSSGKEEEKTKLEISNPVFSSNGKFLVVAEKDKKRIYSIHDKDILWQKDLDGDISRISVNANGYISVILSGTTYKSVIVVFDKDGKELFRTYLSNTIAVDTSISDDNQYMSFAEINTSGTLIQSTIKIVSIEKAKQKPNEAIIYTYTADEDAIAINIKYQNKNTLIAIYNDKIEAIKNNKVEVIKRLDNKQEKVTFSDIELKSYVFRILEKSSGLFNSDTTVEITNTSNSKESIYSLQGVAKSVYSNEDVIAINLGSEIHFVGASNGWLIKKYMTRQEAKDIVLTSKVAAIIYHDRVEIINL